MISTWYGSRMVATLTAKKAVRRSWKSDGSAGIYCRCRALPLVIEFSEVFSDAIEGHVRRVLSQLLKAPDRLGIGEADPEVHPNPQEWSPPNAFHTYWALEVLRKIKRRFPIAYTRLDEDRSLDLELKRKGMLSWTQQRLGYEISLHSEPKS